MQQPRRTTSNRNAANTGQATRSAALGGSKAPRARERQCWARRLRLRPACRRTRRPGAGTMGPGTLHEIILVGAGTAATLAASIDASAGRAAKNPVVDAVSSVVRRGHVVPPVQCSQIHTQAMGPASRWVNAEWRSGDFLLPEMPVNGLPGAAGSNGDAGRVGRFGVLVGFYFHAASSSSRRSGARVEACGPPETSTRLAAGFGVGIAYAQCAIHPSGWFPRSGPRDRIRLVQYTIIGPIWQLRMGCHCT